MEAPKCEMDPLLKEKEAKVIELKTNNIPRGLVSLKSLFKKDDK